jgi:hypothetical protein
MHLAEAGMKRLNLIFALAILLAGCATGPTYTPSYDQGYGGGQGYGGYNYPPAPQNVSATPWVGANTPWTYYQGDWFLNGLLYQNFGNQYGWAPYYSYPPTYIVRPNNWYAPQWNAWYQRNPHYWKNFEQKYPYWRGHRVGQSYDQNFYNQHHRGQGGGWHKGFQGVRPPATAPSYGVRTPGAGPGHDVRPPAAPGRDHRAIGGPGTQAPVGPGRGVRDPRATGGGPPPGTITPGVRGPAAAPGREVRPPATAPGQRVRPPAAPGRGHPRPEAVTPGVRPPAAGPGPTVRPPAAAPGREVRPPATAPGQRVHPPVAAPAPGGRPSGPAGPAVRDPRAPGGPGVQAPGAAGREVPAPGGRRPQKTTRDEERPQQ